MSYILDALRRADAQRQRAAVPGLHDQPATLGPAEPLSAPRSVPLAWVLMALAGLLLLALAAWWWPAALVRQTAPNATLAAAAPASVADPAPANAHRAAASSPAALTVATPAPSPVTPAAPQAAVTSTGSTTVTVTVNGPPAAAPTRVAVVAAPVATASPPLAVPSAAAVASAPLAPATAPAADRLSAETRVPALASLPEAFRRQLPPLALGGGMYAEQPSQRLVLVNGQVAHEGDDLGRGLRLMQIRPRSVVFALGEQLFELAL